MSTAFPYKSAFSSSSPSEAVNHQGSLRSHSQNKKNGMAPFREFTPSDTTLQAVLGQLVQSQEEIHNYERTAKARTLTQEELRSLAISILIVDRNEQYLKKHASVMAYD